MDGADKRKQIVEDVFCATGAKMEPDDPLVTATLYYSLEMRAAGAVVASELNQAASDLRNASQLAVAAHGAVVADRAKLMKDIEAHIANCVKSLSKEQSRFQDLRYIPTWYAVVGALVGAVFFAATWKYGVLQGTDLAEEAAVGRAFKRAAPLMDPALKAEVIKQLRK